MSRFEVALAGVLPVAGTARALDITSCGVLVPPGEIGDLQADLSCPATSGFCVRDPSVSCTSSAECPPPPCDAHGRPLPTCSLDGGTLGGNATLHMNGHSISGGTVGVFCRSKCLVEGPGEIFGVESAVVFLRARAAVQNLNVHDTTFFGIGSPILGSLDLANVTLSNIGDNAIRAGRVSATNVTVTNSGNVYGAVYANARLRGANVTVTANPEYGVFCNGSVKVSGLVATDNGEEGLVATRALLTDSTLTGNDAAGEGVDLRATSRPVLVNTTCGRSGRIPSDTGESWGVCTGD
ncbi:MAG: hypothetical protein E6J76_10640 [Deltaproteobacteria bacterium]|nr:MAG: hypothetical protein E6J76_10640 [Deltaproteobacteria bacterium]